MRAGRPGLPQGPDKVARSTQRPSAGRRPGLPQGSGQGGQVNPECECGQEARSTLGVRAGRTGLPRVRLWAGGSGLPRGPTVGREARSTRGPGGEARSTQNPSAGREASLAQGPSRDARSTQSPSGGRRPGLPPGSMQGGEVYPECEQGDQVYCKSECGQGGQVYPECKCRQGG